MQSISMSSGKASARPCNTRSASETSDLPQLQCNSGNIFVNPAGETAHGIRGQSSSKVESEALQKEKQEMWGLRAGVVAQREVLAQHA